MFLTLLIIIISLFKMIESEACGGKEKCPRSHDLRSQNSEASRLVSGAGYFAIQDKTVFTREDEIRVEASVYIRKFICLNIHSSV